MISGVDSLSFCSCSEKARNPLLAFRLGLLCKEQVLTINLL